MRRPLSGRNSSQRYDHEAIVEMAKTMTRKQIIKQIGISEAYLGQVLVARGVRARPVRLLKTCILGDGTRVLERVSVVRPCGERA